VAEGLRPSSTRENAEPNIRDSTNTGKPRPSKHHKIREGGGKYYGDNEETEIWGSELKSGCGRRGRRKDKKRLPKLKSV